MWKDKSQVSWAGKPISEVPFAVLKECLDYSTKKAEDETNKNAKYAANDVRVLLAEMNLRESGEKPVGEGPGSAQLSDEEWPDTNPFDDEGTASEPY